MDTIYIKAKSFKDARAKLTRGYFLEGEPIRLSCNEYYKFVNPKLKESLEKELPINKVMKKYRETFKY